MIRTEKRLRLCGALLALNLCFIWGNSLLPAEVSQAFSDWVRELLSAVFAGGEAGASGGSGFLRKIAHFTEFMALGMCLSWLSGMLGKGRHWPLLLGCGAACMDETIQCFVPGRGPGLVDVGIDTCGVIMGMMILLAGHYYLKKLKLKENM